MRHGAVIQDAGATSEGSSSSSSESSVVRLCGVCGAVAVRKDASVDGLCAVQTLLELLGGRNAREP